MTPEKTVPVITTVVSVPAEVGENEPTVGLGKKVKPVFVPVPPLVTTLTLPLVPVFTTAVIWVALLTVYDFALLPPKVTEVALVKPVPVMTTELSVPAEAGVKEVIAGVQENELDVLKVKPAAIT